MIDTLSTGPEMVLLMEKLRKLMDQGLDFDQTVAARCGSPTA